MDQCAPFLNLAVLHRRRMHRILTSDCPLLFCGSVVVAAGFALGVRVERMAQIVDKITGFGKSVMTAAARTILELSLTRDDHDKKTGGGRSVARCRKRREEIALF